MNCLIVSDQIRVQMDNKDMAVPADEVTGRGMSTPSALQTPDMSRMRLAAMLRRSGAGKTIDGARLTWNVMLNRCVAECANSNG
jgi:hypothetical protein